MGGRGSSSEKGTSGAWTVRRELTAQDGSKIDLSANPLKYGKEDAALTGGARSSLETFENRRYNNKIEFSRFVDADGNVIEDNKGGKGSVGASYNARMTAAAMSHNHPRSGDEMGILGGTFSSGDLRNFGKYNQTTYRATALEGTYSISKGKGFDAEGLNRYYQAEQQRIDKSVKERIEKSANKYDAVYKAYKQGKATFSDVNAAYDSYVSDWKKETNRSFVAYHNALIAGQKKYGYTYTLERRK